MIEHTGLQAAMLHMQLDLLMLQWSAAGLVQRVVAAVVFLWLLWGVYIVVMGLYRAHLEKRLTRAGTVFGVPYLIIGYGMDVLANLLIASLVFLEPPREWLVTTRLTRHIASTNWRGDVARWICTNLLDVFDPSGRHCASGKEGASS